MMNTDETGSNAGLGADGARPTDESSQWRREMDTIKIEDNGIFIPWDDMTPNLIVEVAEYLRDMNQPVPEGMAEEYNNLCGDDLDQVLNPSDYDRMHSAAGLAAWRLKMLAEADPELFHAVTPDTKQRLTDTVASFASFVDNIAEAGRGPEYLNEFRYATNRALAAMLLQFPFGDVETERPNRQLALETADALGPDRAQLLYRFAVLVTKLA